MYHPVIAPFGLMISGLKGKVPSGNGPVPAPGASKTVITP